MTDKRAFEAHGHTTHARSSPTYRSWISMRRRCLNPKTAGYDQYGGRGIQLDPRWLDFRNFLDDMGERPNGTTLDRKDNDGNYNKANCRWATPKQQRSNQRDGIYAVRKNGLPRGVYRTHSDASYYATISVNNYPRYLGSFHSVDEAALAYNKAAIELRGRFAILNPVGESPR